MLYRANYSLTPPSEPLVGIVTLTLDWLPPRARRLNVPLRPRTQNETLDIILDLVNDSFTLRDKLTQADVSLLDVNISIQVGRPLRCDGARQARD